MPNSDIADFQSEVAARLRRIIGNVDVTCEWAAMTDERDIYSPRLDIAVGPFAVGTEMFGDRFTELARAHSALLRYMYELHVQNVLDLNRDSQIDALESVVERNWNSRCFIAIEIENQVSRKHLMGGAINAAALGRVGIVVGWDQEKLRALLKLREYLLYLARVGKNTFAPFNLLILDPTQLLDAISRCEPHE